MPAFEILPGLPPYGPMAKPFPSSGYASHREGFVVQFSSQKIGLWIGNFQRGLTNFSNVYEHPDGKRVVVVSGGDGYVIDPERQVSVANFSSGARNAYRGMAFETYR
jgi:hypothetical protein